MRELAEAAWEEVALELGKFPPQLLERLLGQVPATDPQVLIGPGIGEDAAVIAWGDKLLVAKSDPITLAPDIEIGRASGRERG